MDKENVMKALFLCGTGSETCAGCPYYAMNDCDRHMRDDALGLLKADEKANEKLTYHMAIIFTKRDNLLKWLYNNYERFGTHGTTEHALRIRAEYEREREVQLILLVRFEEGKTICKIRCPINPLPIKGEFEAPNVGAVSRTLTEMGWTYKEKLPLGLFR